MIGDKHPYFVAKQWTQLQELCLAQRERAGDERFFGLCYEDLTSDPKHVVQQLCEFLEISFNEDMLAFHRSDEANRTAVSSDLWSNLTQPIINGNSKKFLATMSEEDICTVESVAGHIMDELGYERHLIESGEEVNFAHDQINRYKQLNEARKQERAKNAEPEDLRRRQKQSQVLNDIEQRLKQATLLRDSREQISQASTYH